MNESELLELPGSRVWTRLGLGRKKPQINADERRLIVFDFESLFEVYSDRKIVQTLTGQLKLINSLQTTSMWHGEVHQPRNRTRMARIARIFTDLSASVKSAFYLNAPMLWHEKINNELIRTIYELTLPEFVSVRISSLFSRCYLAGLLDINSPYIAAFFRVHPRLKFNREMRERGALAG